MGMENNRKAKVLNTGLKKLDKPELDYIEKQAKSLLEVQFNEQLSVNNYQCEEREEGKDGV